MKKEYQENYDYVLEAKLVLHPKILVSIQAEFEDNEDGKELDKQDCERKAFWFLTDLPVTRKNVAGLEA